MLIRFIALTLLLLIARPALAGPLTDGLSGSDKRVVQAALSLSLDYDGLIDGAFGARSDRALNAALARRAAGTGTEEALAALLRNYRAEWMAYAWEGIRSPSGVFSLVRPADQPPGLSVTVSLDGNNTAREKHADLAAAHTANGQPYTVRRNDFWVTSSEDVAGGRVYLRSDRQGRLGFDTVRIEADAANRGRLQLIASSISDRARPDLEPPVTGPLAALMGPVRQAEPLAVVSDPAPAAPAPAPAPADPVPEPAADPAPPDAAPAATALAVEAPDWPDIGNVGTAVFVAPGQLVTTSAVADACPAPTLTDGTALTRIARSEELGLALLSAAAAGPVPAWLAPSGNLSLGNQVFLLHRADRTARFGVARANVAAVTGMTSGFMLLRAEADSASLGAAVVTRRGELVGILTERPGSDAMAPTMATSSSGLRGFLTEAGVAFAETRPARGTGVMPNQAIAGVVCP